MITTKFILRVLIEKKVKESNVSDHNVHTCAVKHVWLYSGNQGC